MAGLTRLRPSVPRGKNHILGEEIKLNNIELPSRLAASSSRRKLQRALCCPRYASSTFWGGMDSSFWTSLSAKCRTNAIFSDAISQCLCMFSTHQCWSHLLHFSMNTSPYAKEGGRAGGGGTFRVAELETVICQCVWLSELLGRTRSFIDTRTASPSVKSLPVPLEGTARRHGALI